MSEQIEGNEPEGIDYDTLHNVFGYHPRGTDDLIADVPCEIIPNLWLGNCIHALYDKSVSLYKWDHIFNIGINFPKTWKYTVDSNFWEIADKTSANITILLDEITALMHEKLKAGQKVYVHCHQGVSRSTTVVIAYLMKYLHMSFDEAYDLVIDKRSIADPNRGFIQQLKEYGERCCSI